MTETEKMRAILHERGIEYRDVNSMVTDVEHDGIKTRVYDYDDGPDYQLCVEQKWLTAEEAVRVALGIKPQEDLERENAKLREAVATAIKVQAVLCGDADSLYCRNKCPLHRPESNDCLACDVIGVAQELGVEVTP